MLALLTLHVIDLGMYANVAVHEPILARLIAQSPRANMVFNPVNFSATTAARPSPSRRTADVPVHQEEWIETPAPAPAVQAGQTVAFRDLELHGRGFNISGPDDFFTRLPPQAEGVVREEVWGLSEFSTGLFVRFGTDATRYACGMQTSLDDAAKNMLTA
jgi:hypothetical protein